VNNQPPPNYIRLRPPQLDNTIAKTIFSLALRIRLYVPQITHMAHLRIRATMRLVKRVEMRTHTRALITQITRLMNVKTVERVWAQSYDVKFNLDLIILQIFCEFDEAMDARLVHENGDCMNRSCCIHYYKIELNLWKKANSF
jgi:hypothetical protein